MRGFLASARTLTGRTTGGFSEGIYSIRFVQFELSAVDMPRNERTEEVGDTRQRGEIDIATP